jgi:hypothetical protein
MRRIALSAHGFRSDAGEVYLRVQKADCTGFDWPYCPLNTYVESISL